MIGHDWTIERQLRTFFFSHIPQASTKKQFLGHSAAPLAPLQNGRDSNGLHPRKRWKTNRVWVDVSPKSYWKRWFSSQSWVMYISFRGGAPGTLQVFWQKKGTKPSFSLGWRTTTLRMHQHWSKRPQVPGWCSGNSQGNRCFRWDMVALEDL